MTAFGDPKTLVFIPTYNEFGNSSKLIQSFIELPIKFDVLFIDDNSTDGTGQEQDSLASKYSWVKTIHRSGKMGIGSAHKDALTYAYASSYEQLITMDADFTHPPNYLVPLFINVSNTDVVIGSRHLIRGSTDGWNIMRKFMTKAGYFMTSFILDMPFDATNAFRLYRISKIPHRLFHAVESDGYSFFYESLFILHGKKISISQIPMVMPPREAGLSKMAFKDVFRSVYFVFALRWRFMRHRFTHLY